MKCTIGVMRLKMNTKRPPTVVDEVNYGLYVWQMPDGRWVGDDEGNFLNVKCNKGDIQKIKILQEAVRSYGIEEGSPFFLSGHRRVTDEEFEEQKKRMEWGLIPDVMDIPALVEELRHRNGN